MNEPRAEPSTSTGSRSPLSSPFSEDGLEAAAIRGRVAVQLFGGAAAPVRIGRYEIQARVGAGGMGVVYAARDPDLDRQVAVKVVAPRRGGDPRQRERLLEEARALARLSHPNVVQIYEVGEHEGGIFLALELIDGETLAAWQRRPGRDWREILAAYVGAARGLSAAHELGVIHRDVKPSNMLVGADGRVRVVDFGLARATDAAVEAPTAGEGTSTDPSRAGPAAGTPAYMSPEQARGRECDARSDLFSLCVALFEGLYGLRPFEAPERLRPQDRVDERVLWRRVPRGSKAPRWTLAVLARGLQPDPQKRFADMASLIAALEAAPRRVRRIRQGLVGAFAAGLAGWTLSAATAAAPVCPDVSDVLPGAWDPARKAAIERRFSGSGLPYATTAWQQAERSLDAAVLEWSRARRGSCMRTRVERTQSEEQFDLASECLDEHARSIRALTDRLAAAGPDEITQAYALIGGLGEPARCTSTEVLRGGPAPPATPALRERVTQLRRELDAVRMATTTARFEEADARLVALVDAASVYPPLHAEVMYQRGVVAAGRGELEEADRIFAAAGEEAEHVRDDRLMAAILGDAAELAIRRRREPREGRVYLDLYGAKLGRIEADAGGRATYLDRRGEWMLLTGDASGALADHEEAARLHPSSDLVGRARSLRGSANALAELGRIDASIDRLFEARELLARELGAGHPATALVEVNLAQSLWERPGATADDLLRAEGLLRGALEIGLRHEGRDGVGAARTRIVLAGLLQARGEVEQPLKEIEYAMPGLMRWLAPTHDDVVAARSMSFNLQLERRAWAAAGEEAAALLRIYAARGEPVPFELLNNIGEVYVRRGDPLAATPFFDQALALASLSDPIDPLRLGYALNGRAKLNLLRGELVQARALYERALAQAEAIDEPIPELLAELKWGLSQALVGAGQDVGRARRLAQEARAILRAAGAEASYLADLEAIRVQSSISSR